MRISSCEAACACASLDAVAVKWRMRWWQPRSKSTASSAGWLDGWGEVIWFNINFYYLAELLPTQAFHGIEPSGASGGHRTEYDPDQRRHQKRNDNRQS